MVELSNSAAVVPEGVERRQRINRRQTSVKTAVYSLHGRRSLGRRAEDQVNVYVDRYELRYLFVVLAITLLCCADALFTLNLIYSGVAQEANPIMRYAMDESIHLFLITKFALTSVGLFVLVAHKNFHVFSRVKVSHLLYGVLIMYAVLIKYELWLFSL